MPRLEPAVSVCVFPAPGRSRASVSKDEPLVGAQAFVNNKAVVAAQKMVWVFHFEFIDPLCTFLGNGTLATCVILADSCRLKNCHQISINVDSSRFVSKSGRHGGEVLDLVASFLAQQRSGMAIFDPILRYFYGKPSSFVANF